jgi:hypothetical protein
LRRAPGLPRQGRMMLTLIPLVCIPVMRGLDLA